MRIYNRKAKFNYEILEKLEAGISLTGGEAKAIRDGRADIANSYARIIGGEAYLVNASITPPGAVGYDSTRSRKLLLHRNEIEAINAKIKAKRLTLVPISLYNKRRLVKVELALAKSKRKFEKKETIKKRDLERELKLR